MKITADTNILVRALVQDDPGQSALAVRTLREAELIAISLPCLCELVWVLRRVYHFDTTACATAIRALIEAANVAMNRSATEAGLTVLEAGGDFADGVIVHEGRWLGGDIFLSFDRKAVKLLAAQGEAAKLLK